jgi:hypothetical protein
MNALRRAIAAMRITLIDLRLSTLRRQKIDLLMRAEEHERAAAHDRRAAEWTGAEISQQMNEMKRIQRASH